MPAAPSSGFKAGSCLCQAALDPRPGPPGGPPDSPPAAQPLQHFSFTVSRALLGLDPSPSCAATWAWNSLALLIKSICSSLKNG